MSDVTQILAAIERGDPNAAEQLLPVVYAELRRLAAVKLADEKSGQTLQPTALVHEAYLRLVDQKQAQRWEHRGHFFCAAAEAMRRILVENARRKDRIKHGGRQQRVDLDLARIADAQLDEDLISLNEALEELEQAHARKAELVKLRFFGGLTTKQAAKALAISVATADREWAYARAWLLRRLTEPARAGDS